MTPEELLERHPRLKDVVQRLVSKGGNTFEVPRRPDDKDNYFEKIGIERLPELGDFFDNWGRRAKIMKDNHCHFNTVTLVCKKEVAGFATGLALQEGVWYHHTWGLMREGNQNVIIETTESRFESYFGVQYWGADAMAKAKDGYWFLTFGETCPESAEQESGATDTQN